MVVVGRTGRPSLIAQHVAPRPGDDLGDASAHLSATGDADPIDAVHSRYFR